MDKVRIGIVGCGRISTLHAPGYLMHPHAELAACCDINRTKAEAWAVQFGVGKVHSSFEDMLADPDIDAVEIITPHDTHCSMVEAAAEASKHVSVQKPMAMDLSECDRMIAATAKAEVTFKVFENFVFYPPYRKAKELMDAGEIGEPLAIRIKLNSGGPAFGWPIPLTAWAWRFHRDRCGGGPLIWDDGYHKFSIARYFMGEVEKVFAWIAQTDMLPIIQGMLADPQALATAAADPEDMAEALKMLVGPDGNLQPLVIDAPAVIVWKYRGADKFGVWDAMSSFDMEIWSEYYATDERVEITGTKGVIWVNQCTGRLQNTPPVILYRKGETIGFENIPSGWETSFEDSARHFVDCLLSGGQIDPVLTGESGREVTRFAIAAHLSARQGREVTLDEVGPHDRP
ncbi:MAG: Gfo/Idh/MocA family oxidoreductase [Actinomycetota bacterium]